MVFRPHATCSKIIFPIFILFSVQQFETYAVNGNIDDISSELERIRGLTHMPGLSALVFKNGQIVAQAAVGYRRQGYGLPLLLTDLINIGSCTKWMTATVAGRLVDRKLLSWTTQVHECFSDSSSFNSALRNATLEQLLAHRAGVQQSNTFYKNHLQEFIAQQGNITEIRRWVAETVLKDEPEVTSGEYLYSNPGYTVAAVMMEYITGQEWETLIRGYIFIPLRMTTAMIGSVYDDDLPPKAPVGHDLLANETVPIPRPMLPPHIYHIEKASTGPAGFIACTLHDWTKFLHAHVIGESTGYLSADTAAKLKRPYVGTEGYGLGVIVNNRTWATPGQALSHDGDSFGQNVVFLMAPGRDLIIVIYTNCRSVDNWSGKALNGVADYLVIQYSNTTINSSIKIKVTVWFPVSLFVFLYHSFH